MRLTSDFWVSALLRNCFRTGGFAAVARRGATEAGAIFVIVRNRLGETTLYGPAPQASYEAARPDERLFTMLIENAEASAVDERLARETRFDPDVWIVEVEPGQMPVAELIAVTKP